MWKEYSNTHSILLKEDIDQEETPNKQYCTLLNSQVPFVSLLIECLLSARQLHEKNKEAQCQLVGKASRNKLIPWHFLVWKIEKLNVPSRNLYLRSSAHTAFFAFINIVQPLYTHKSRYMFSIYMYIDWFFYNIYLYILYIYFCFYKYNYVYVMC